MKKLLANTIFRNIISLLILQGSNYILPLLTFPYLVRTLGTEHYGKYIFIVTLMQFLNLICDYGFNISATKDIAVNRFNNRKIEQIYNLVITIKLIFTFLVGILLFIGIILFVHSDKSLYFIAFLIVVGNSLFPIWLFQGLENMRYITILNIISKLINTMLIFILVHNSDDLNIAISLQAINYILPSIMALYIIIKHYKFEPKLILESKLIKEQINSGFYIFITTLWINFYTQGPIIILGWLTNSKTTGQFGVGQKIMAAFSGLIAPVSQAVYPHMCLLYEKDRNKFHQFKKTLNIIVLIIGGIIATGMIFASSTLTKIVTGEDNFEIAELLKFFAFAIFFAVMNTILAREMYAMNRQKVLNKLYFVASIIFLIVSFPLTIKYYGLGMCISIVITEGIIFILNTRNMIGSKTVRTN
ncbi:flippase [Sporolactobacillus spathodeae]|uniref:PST family polysaccharide transporter n=1 Tax=Sporolactobacillus spathodeae TaxID=1465502 RepID=A0ABS2Q7M0_9BACL|nr:flippase [Sporolactobacillus spathodeae]MBM7657786.1 PST family polysaccharide transporter [Sporolactobacillus spathodeae]